MSRRTAKASKAVRDAWKEEQERVRMGKGTRDWTPEQQKEILESGRAYYHSDDPNDKYDGKAFDGHHMKSVEAFPEFQGDSANIQFLSRPEHKEAHRGDYKNASNWYFDPVTHEFTDFGEGEYIPCTVIDLSEPIVFIDSETKAVKEQPQTDKTATSPDKTKSSSPPHTNKSKTVSHPTKTTPTSSDNGDSFFTHVKARLQSAGKGIAGFGKMVASGAYKHRKKIAAVVFIRLARLAAEEKIRRGASRNSNDSPIENDDRRTDFSDSVVEETIDDTFTYEEDDDCEDTSKGTHKSPCPHLRHVGERKFKTKDGYVYHDIGDVPVNGYDPTSIDSDEE